jgi:biopolymer transport protein ExbB
MQQHDSREHKKDAAMLRCTGRGTINALAIIALIGFPALAFAQGTPEALPTVSAVGSSDLPRDLSPWGMFLSADPLVKAVLLGLAFASVVTWTVWLAKTIELLAANRRARRGLAALASARHLAEAAQRLGKVGGAVGQFVNAAVTELRLSEDGMEREGVKERLVSRLQRIEANRGRAMMRGTGVLATIGATAPFVGLFGTVWGIMTSFQAIAASKNTSLAVVAPGIAEALFATAIGLIAAIPATIFYNKFTSEVNRQAQRLEGFADEFSAILSRQIDERA